MIISRRELTALLLVSALVLSVSANRDQSDVLETTTKLQEKSGNELNLVHADEPTIDEDTIEVEPSEFALSDDEYPDDLDPSDEDEMIVGK